MKILKFRRQISFYFLRDAVKRPWLICGLVFTISFSRAVGGPLACQELMDRFHYTLSYEPNIFLSQSDPRLLAANFNSSVKGNMLCGPTCVFNLEQVVRRNLGVEIVHDPVSYLFAKYQYLKNKKNIDLRDGLFPRDLAEVFGLAMTDATGRSLFVNLKSIYPVTADVPWIRAFSGSIVAGDLPVSREPGMTIVAVEPLEKMFPGPWSHYLAVISFDPAKNTLQVLDPNKPRNYWWSTIRTTSVFRGGRWLNSLEINLDGKATFIRSVMNVNFAD